MLDTFAVGVSSRAALRAGFLFSHSSDLRSLCLIPLASCHLLQLHDKVSYLLSHGRPLCRLSAACWLCTTAVNRAFLPGSKPTIRGACRSWLSGMPLTHAEVACCCCRRLRFLEATGGAETDIDPDVGRNIRMLTLIPSVSTWKWTSRCVCSVWVQKLW